MIDQTGASKNIFDRQRKPMISLVETWQDEAGIDASIWATTNPATGAAWSRGDSWWTLRATSAPNASENCRLVSTMRWEMGPNTTWTVGSIWRKLHLEFMMKLTNTGNLDTASFWGWTATAAAIRTTTNIIGFGSDGAGNLLGITDNAGTENAQDLSAAVTMSNWNLYGIVARLGAVEFWANGALAYTRTTMADIVSTPMYLNFYTATDAGGAATIEIGSVRAWLEDKDGLRY